MILNEMKSVGKSEEEGTTRRKERQGGRSNKEQGRRSEEEEGETRRKERRRGRSDDEEGMMTKKDRQRKKKNSKFKKNLKRF